MLREMLRPVRLAIRQVMRYNSLMTTNQTSTTIEVTLPRVVNLREASILAPEYPAIITAGPSLREVDWGHSNHHVETFSDTTWGIGKPTIEAVERMLDFASGTDEILVHCHAGMSRSTSTAWGILMDRGVDPFLAFEALKSAHPAESRGYKRAFIPNTLIVKHLESLFGYEGLVQYANHHEFHGSGW